MQQQKKKVRVLNTEDNCFALAYPQDNLQVDKKVTALFAKKG